ncbi:MAG: DUF1844 domain-containing protein [Candidatus Omnitrophica bacterium]|nr:DUF1844 domain-containing protein [Candidatus Omnitrophota bacterium]
MDNLKPIEKRVDESWKETVERERHTAAQSQPDASPPAGSQKPAGAPAAPQPPREPAGRPRPEPPAQEPEERESESHFMVFLSSLSMQAMMSLGELPVPGTNHRQEDLEQARYLIDTIGLLQEKTQGNLTPEETQFLDNVLYELRVRYTQKTQPPLPPPPGTRR